MNDERGTMNERQLLLVHRSAFIIHRLCFYRFNATGKSGTVCGFAVVGV